MSQALVRQALETKLNAWAASQSIPVAWENVEFTQPEGRYLRAFLLPIPVLSEDLARAHRRFEGVFQVSIVMPTGAGPGASDALVSAISAQFPPSVPLIAGALTVYVTQPLSPAPAIQEPDRYVIPCSLSYRADSY